ncbi:MAG TPA: hypothetical protein VM925_37200 [Labilithrix sp.]|jgi:hypothetical protein|nr:hypothetical protein [Labilithrix sp.]
MTFRVIRMQHLWCVDDPTRRIGGLFVDLASAIRFIRRYESSARIVIRATPSDPLT